MVTFRKLGRGEDLVGYASLLAHHFFKDVVRDTGLPYTQEHLAEVARLVKHVTVPSSFQDSAVAAAWLHDLAEDIEGVGAFNPFETRVGLKKDVLYLNDLLLEEAGNSGIATAYMVHMLTHDPSIPYLPYVNEIFHFPSGTIERTWKILTSIIKMADRRKNIDPNDEKSVDGLVQSYIVLASSGATTQQLEEFYRKTKVIDAFTKKGSMSLDIGLFTETVRQAFRHKQQAVAIDNLAYYLPLAENALLIGVGENNGLFNYERMREMLKATYADSLQLSGLDIHVVKKLGLNRSMQYPEKYTPIRKEFR